MLIVMFVFVTLYFCLIYNLLDINGTNEQYRGYIGLL